LIAMTEKQWLAWDDCRDPTLFTELERWPAARTPRLLACAACRLVWDKLTDQRSRTAIEEAERYCDGETTRKALTAAHRAAVTAYREARRGTPARNACWAASKASRPTNPTGGMDETLTIISAGEDNPWHDLLLGMIRDAYGPRLFRSVPVDSAWLTSNVVALARGIYTDRAFDRLPILADALEDAGCTDADILAHCRGGGEHVRGCWVVDLLTGRE
jgi:hypothetical protein